jgi:hypothetical protein
MQSLLLIRRICRRAETNDQFQNYELGAKPVAPAKTTGTVSRTQIAVTVSDADGNSISFTATVQASAA